MSDTSALCWLHGGFHLGDDPTPDLDEGQFSSLNAMLLAEHASEMQKKSAWLQTQERSLPGRSPRARTRGRMCVHTRGVSQASMELMCCGLGKDGFARVTASFHRWVLAAEHQLHRQDSSLFFASINNESFGRTAELENITSRTTRYKT